MECLNNMKHAKRRKGLGAVLLVTAAVLMAVLGSVCAYNHLLNSFSGKLLEYIDEKYNHRYRLHGYYPYPVLADSSRDPREYLYCLCLILKKEMPDGKTKKSCLSG